MGLKDWWKRETQCIFGHDWHKIGGISPISDKDEFSTSSDRMAMGECGRCGKREMQYIGGSCSYYRSEIITRTEYYKEYNYDPITYEDLSVDNG